MPTGINDEEFEILSPVILQLSTCLPTFFIIKMYLSSIIMLVGIILVLQGPVLLTPLHV